MRHAHGRHGMREVGADGQVGDLIAAHQLGCDQALVVGQAGIDARPAEGSEAAARRQERGGIVLLRCD
jgi:hypothetical protein